MTLRSVSVSSSLPAAGAAASAAGAAAAAAGAPVVPLAIALTFLTSSDTSTRSSGSPLPTFSIICSKESTHLKITSMISSLTFSCSLRSKSSKFSISWVSSAILVYPIVADIPFNVCALRKISLRTDKSAGLLSKLSRPSFSDCKCSRDSSKNISMY